MRRGHGRQLRLLPALAILAGLVVSVPAQAACAGTNHVGIRWGSLPALVGEFGPVYLYYAEEPSTGDASTFLEIRTTDIGSCPTPPQPTTANYAVDTPVGTSRPATPSQDYEAILAGNTGLLYDHRGSPNEHPIHVTIHSDLVPEPVVEEARARITATDAIRDTPQELPLYIIDSDGFSRASLESSGPYSQKESFREVVIPVFRAGDASQPLEVGYSFQGSSSAPATPGTDFIVTSPQPLVFGPGERAKVISLQLRADGVTEPEEEATVTLSSPGVLDPTDRVSATVRLIDSPGGVAPPTSTLHHPRHNRRYPKNDFRMREVHIFTKKGGGGAVVSAELALRMNRARGQCSWFDGRRFRPGECGQPIWFKSDGEYEPGFFYRRFRQLKPSAGKIRDYTMYSRAIDLSRYVEENLVQGRNANTFEIRKAKRKNKKGRA